MKETIDRFLKENKAIFSYLKDVNGNKIGVILALPGEDNRKEPRIGYAFFPEVVNNKDYNDQFEKVKYLYEVPSFLKKIEYITQGNSNENDLKYLKFPKNCEIYRYKPECIKRNETIYLARKRANYNSSLFYVNLDEKDPQSNSILYGDNSSDIHIIGKQANKKSSNYMATPPGIVMVSNKKVIAHIRHQIRSFEYRALKYYKYVEGYKH